MGSGSSKKPTRRTIRSAAGPGAARAGVEGGEAAMPIADSMGDDEEDFVDELKRTFAGDGDVMDMADQDDRASLAESHVNELDDVFEDEVACHGIGEEGGPAADARPGVGRSEGRRWRPRGDR